VARSIQRRPAAAQQLGRLVGVDIKEPLELFGGQGTD
jgi:hypothetical protein